MKILVLHGPNLNLLGEREPVHYGRSTLADVDATIAHEAAALGVSVEARQSNHEGQLVDWLHEARASFDGVVLNAAAYTHTSIALGDAVRAIAIPVVEVHLSNVFAREAFRHVSMIAPAAIGSISGFGPLSYALGLRALVGYLSASRDRASLPRPALGTGEPGGT